MKKQKKVEKKRAPTWIGDYHFTDKLERDYEKRFGQALKKKRTKKSNIRKK
jgi:hypothetical protein|tara:strand:+ start:354 stop:506 length:153 start_codon:yes stop_codon:yes gene_type:complete